MEWYTPELARRGTIYREAVVAAKEGHVSSNKV